MGMVSPSLVGRGRLLRYGVNTPGLERRTDPHNFAYFPTTLRKKCRHDVAKFCWMIHHSYASILESLSLRFRVALAWCGPGSCVTHHSTGFGIYPSYQSRNWPVLCYCGSSVLRIGVD